MAAQTSRTKNGSSAQKLDPAGGWRCAVTAGRGKGAQSAPFTAVSPTLLIHRGRAEIHSTFGIDADQKIIAALRHTPASARRSRISTLSAGVRRRRLKFGARDYPVAMS